MSIVRTDIKLNEWIEINYKGKKYLVGVSGLLDAYIEKQLRDDPVRKYEDNDA